MGATPLPPQKAPRKASKLAKGSHLLAIVWCAFTFIQCSYKGEAKINGKKPGKVFRVPYASRVVGNDKAFIEPKSWASGSPCRGPACR